MVKLNLGLPGQVALVSDGAVASLYHVCHTLLGPGDELLTTDPTWNWPMVFARSVGASVRQIPIYGAEHRYRLDPARLAEAIGPRTKLVYLVDPNNPLGTACTEGEVAGIVDVVRRSGAWLVHDCTYRHFAYEHHLAARLMPERTITIYSFSKWLGLAGLRIGAMVVDPDLAELLAAAPPNNLGSSIGEVPRRSIEVVAWTNEEGCRFSPGMTGSELYAGAKRLEDLAGLCDAAGEMFGDAIGKVLAADRDVPLRPLGRAAAALVEPHIEQGPVLERAGIPVGVVSGIQGTRRYRVQVSGQASHAGTAERAERRDALMAAVRMVAAIDRAARDPTDIKLTVGLFQVTPNAPSVVPEQVLFSIDLRHPEDAVVDRIDAAIRHIVAAEAPPCEAVLRQIQRNPTVTFSPAIRSLIGETAGALEIGCRELASAAGHDARSLNEFCPTGMIFVPCRDGLSHHPAEWAEPGDLAAGARVLTDVIWELAKDGRA